MAHLNHPERSARTSLSAGSQDSLRSFRLQDNKAAASAFGAYLSSYFRLLGCQFFSVAAFPLARCPVLTKIQSV